MKWIIFVCILSGCALLQKNETNELEVLAESVLKHKEGIEIDVKPLENNIKK